VHKNNNNPTLVS